METSITTVRGRAVGTAIALVAAIALAFTLLGPATGPADAADADVGGPVILMGLDSELTPNSHSHGPPADHQAMVSALLGAVRNGGEGILVIGPSTGNFRNYWVGDVGDPLGVDVTFVNGVENIKQVSFDGFAMIGVASSFLQVSGGLSNAENEALISRELDIAAFINDGGGLLGKTQDGMSNPFGYVGPLGTFEPSSASFSSIKVTQAGLDLGLTQNGMDGWCCYHEVFDTFPDFMDVLITHDGGGVHQGKAAAIGGVNVVVPTGIELAPTSASLEVGETHTLQAKVEEDDAPVEDREVTFTVVSGPHAGTTGTAETNEQGVATFSYDGAAAGTDRVEASFEDLLGRDRTSNEVTVEWLALPDSLSLAPAEASGTIGNEHSVAATLTDTQGEPISDAEVTFTVVDGPNEGVTGSAETDAEGQATFTYLGEAVGTDVIVATHTPDGAEEMTSNDAKMEWVEVLAAGEEADGSDGSDESGDNEDDEGDVEEIEEADAADAVEAQPDFTG
jgi:hypothetical protein